MKYSSEDLLIFRNIFILTKPSLKRGIEESICQPQNCPSIIILPFNLRHSFKIFTFDIIFIVFIHDGSLQSLSRYGGYPSYIQDSRRSLDINWVCDCILPDIFHQSHNSPTIWISENLAEAEMKMGRRVTLPLPRVSRMQPSSTQNLILSDLQTVCNAVCTERYTQRMELSELHVDWNWAMYMRWVCWRFLVHRAQGVFTLCFKTQHCLTRQY